MKKEVIYSSGNYLRGELQSEDSDQESVEVVRIQNAD